ncbi:MAG: hypothetical protein O3B01_26445 [Planctomycetota bacterium]|nr:hypothetical protein [Planctomycetota bacterium]MDA1142117.1 hypothetical protein [Planctomycetota bacterium]
MPWYSFPSPTIDNIKIKNVWASNVVNNDVTQANQQKGKVGGWWSGGGVSNVVDQTAKNVQQGNDAFNKINVDTNAKKSNVSLNNIGASNFVNNTLVQANEQKGTVSGGWGGVSNSAWQSSTNNQTNNDAFNKINIWA